MATASNTAGMSWSARLLIAISLILAGAAGTAWALARYDGAARFLGVTPQPQQQRVVAVPQNAPQLVAGPAISEEAIAAESAKVQDLELRLARVENSTQRVEGFAGRADALLVAFAARRAIDRGVALGFLEPLINDRFAATHARAVATIVTASRTPVRLNDLVTEYRDLGPALRSSAPEDGFWTQFKRELGSLIQVRRADRPSTQPDARYLRALSRLEDGEVDAALAETMRMPGAPHAQAWIGKARQYVAVHRALDEVESAALLGGSQTAAR
jgi:hypothetical protein